MGSLIELGVDCRFSPKTRVQKPICRFMDDVSKIHGVSDKILKLVDYVNRLQDEMNKIDGLKRELPLCMFFLSEAIVEAQKELAQCTKLNPEPVLEEFMPLKTSSDDEGVEKLEENKEKHVSSRDKKDCSLQLQLWNAADDQNSNTNTDDSSNRFTSKTDTNKKKIRGEEINQPEMDDLFKSERNRAFVPFKGCPSSSVMAVKEDMDELPVQGLSLFMPGAKNSRELINPVVSSYSRSGSSPVNSNLQASFKAGQLQTGRKQRRCWSPDLHRQFINALQHLGGPQAATPKQIREHMQVDGLTNDEVKSHLQKYRLHMRRVATRSTSKQSSGESTSPDGHFHMSRCSEGKSKTILEDEDDE